MLPAPAEAAAFSMLKEQLVDVLGTLTEREQKVLKLRFGLEDGRARTLEEVGKEVRRYKRTYSSDRSEGAPEAASSDQKQEIKGLSGVSREIDMIKLNDRLQIIAERLKDEKTMADIGTDHGFLPVFLLQSGQCDRVILADISVPSLAKAEENCSRYFTGEYEECAARAEFRVGDGLTVLKPGEVDAVVIAGVGGKLITELLERDMEHTCSFRKYVFQPRIGQGILRKWLCDHGFHIIHEDLVEEGHFIPEIITALSPETAGSADEKKDPVSCLTEDILACASESERQMEIFYQIPPWIVSAGGPVEDFYCVC